jgi:hypothetical protein
MYLKSIPCDGQCDNEQWYNHVSHTKEATPH